MKTVTIELMEDVPVILPERSRLYRLPPINRGSGFVESLTSYLARLAAAHCLPLWVLVTREIAPLFRRKSIVDSPNGYCDLIGKYGAAVNGNNGAAIEAVGAVERLTTQSPLRNLTMLSGGYSIAVTPLLRSTQAWCAQCLRNWSESGQELHYPLLWSLAPVQICPVHQSVLVDTCGQCHRSHYPLARRLRIGYCPRCGSWLGCGGATNQSDSASGVPPTPWQLFSATSTAELIADLQRATSSPQTRALHFQANLSSIVEELFDGSRHAFSKYIGVHHTSISDWLAGQQKPSLRAVLLLGYRLGLPPSGFLLAPLGARKATTVRPASALDDACLRPPLRRTAPAKIEQTLRTELEKPTWPPLSLRAVCTGGGFHQTQASKRFPELARKISHRHRYYWSEKRRQGEYFMKILVRSAVYEVCGCGENPSLSKVRAKLSPGISLRDPRVKAECLAVIRELGSDTQPGPT